MAETPPWDRAPADLAYMLRSECTWYAWCLGCMHSGKLDVPELVARLGAETLLRPHPKIRPGESLIEHLVCRNCGVKRLELTSVPDTKEYRAGRAKAGQEAPDAKPRTDRR